MAGVILAEECSSSERCTSSHPSNSYETQDKLDMRGEEDADKESVCTSSISDLACHIPLDLTVEILTRLPVKSLKRFQCVSKEWLSIIGSQGFIDSFSSLSQIQPRFLVAVRNAENRVFLLSSSHNRTERSIPSLVNNLEMMRTSKLLMYLAHSTSLHTNLEMTMSGLLVNLVHCSSVHGFFCFSHPTDPGQFTICNPSTRQLITLPRINASIGRRKEGMYMYLGYDPVVHEYKALCSTFFYGEPCQEHKVLTLGGGRNLSWRDIKGRRTQRYAVVTNGICINGMVYYGGWTPRREKKQMMFRFDVRGERVGYVEMPLAVINCGSLINYKGKVALAYRMSHDPLHRFDVLVLEDFDKQRWSRQLFNFQTLLSDFSGKIMLSILGVTKASEIILGPLKLPPKHEPLYIFYYTTGRVKMLVKRVKLEGLEEFGCNHSSDEQCVCQVYFSPEHFETLVSL